MGIKKLNMSSQKLFFTFLFFLFATASFAQRDELVRKDTMQVQWIKGSKFYLYKVSKGETVYSLTKRFGVTEEDLLKSNPELKEGLKLKMQLLIPAKPLAKNTEPEKKSEDKKNARREIRVGLMLPVNIWKCMIPDSVYADSIHKAFDDESLSQIEFYEGAMHAVDSLASSDLRIHLELYDTENDTVHVGQLLKNPMMKALDFIIATGSQEIIFRLNKFSIANKIVLLTPVLNASEVMKNNSLAYALSPGSVMQCYEAGKICAGKFKRSNAIVVKSGASRENDRSIAFINGWNENSEVNCRSIDYSKGEFKFLLASLVKGANNLIFIPSSNEDFVNSIVTKLNDTTDVYRISLIGIPTWQSFGSNDPAALENLHTHLFTASVLDYEDGATILFRKFFRNEYLTEPSESAYQGYDAMMLIGKSKPGDMPGQEKIQDHNGLYSLYRFKPENGMNENQFIRFVRYEGYKLVEAK